MKLKYLGTAAAEGFPALFCECTNCARAKAAGGRNIRTRSQALVNNRLLIDFPPDTYMHMLFHGLNLPKISELIITHSHSDHLYEKDLGMRRKGFAFYNSEHTLHVYGTAKVCEDIDRVIRSAGLDRLERVIRTEIFEFTPFFVAGLTVTPLAAAHDSASGPVIYFISDDKSNLLYANDTGYFPESTWEWLEKSGIKLDLISLDCTQCLQENKREHHMSLDVNLEVSERLASIGCIDKTTRICLNHFSHNCGVTYDELEPIAAEYGYIISYDGMELDF